MVPKLAGATCGTLRCSAAPRFAALDSLGSLENLRRAHIESGGDLEDHREAWVALAALHAAVVRTVDVAPERERLLGDAAFLA